MDNENELPLSKILENIFRSFFKIFSDIGSLAKTEARLAKQSMISIFFLAIVLVTILTTTWVCLLALIVAYLIYLKLSLLFSLLVVTVLNILIVALICSVMLRLKNDLFFRATRKQLDSTKDLIKGSLHGKPQAKN
jgi:uncharacterized membrane protein YqjE